MHSTTCVCKRVFWCVISHSCVSAPASELHDDTSVLLNISSHMFVNVIQKYRHATHPHRTADIEFSKYSVFHQAIHEQFGKSHIYSHSAVKFYCEFYWFIIGSETSLRVIENFISLSNKWLISCMHPEHILPIEAHLLAAQYIRARERERDALWLLLHDTALMRKRGRRKSHSSPLVLPANSTDYRLRRSLLLLNGWRESDQH